MRAKRVAKGIHHAAEALAAESFDERACQTLMTAYAAGNRAEALRAYAACRKLFRDELGAEPSDQTARSSSAFFADPRRAHHYGLTTAQIATPVTMTV
jgi:DNA-binding SARP family transcriptional activator